jgi:uncharacterized protein
MTVSSTKTPMAIAGTAGRIVLGAKQQLIQPASYDASYQKIPYPGGDVRSDRGACTDVVIRALRNAGYDLQKLIHEDMKSHFASYPGHGVRPDPNIDQRRVPNQRYFFSKHGLQLSIRCDGAYAKSWKPGDIVTWKLDSGKDHTGVLSDTLGRSGLPLVIHNLSQTAEEDVLTEWKITGHYRFPTR